MTLDQLLADAESRVPHDGPPEAFSAALLAALVNGSPVVRAAIWSVEPAEVQQSFEIGAGRETPIASDALRSLSPGAVRFDLLAESSEGNATIQSLCRAELIDERSIVVEVVGPEAAIDEDVILSLTEVLADLSRRALLRRLVQERSGFDQLLGLTSQLLSASTEDRVSAAFAHDAVTLAYCDRVSVCRRTGRRAWQLVAVTGVTTPNARATEVRRVCQIVRATQERDESSGATAEVDDIGSAADESASVDVVPIPRETGWTKAGWAVVFETMAESDAVLATAPSVALVQDRRAMLCDQLTRAIDTAKSRRWQPRWFGGRASAWRRAVTVCALLGIVAWLVLGEKRFDIDVVGEAQPREKRLLFAPEDGVIRNVFVEEGAQVEAGRKLLVLSNDDLELRREALVGDLAAATTRLAALESMRVGNERENAASIAAEKAEVEVKIQSLQTQLTALGQRIDAMTMVAPINGQLYRDGQIAELVHRPVQRGQFLAEIVDPNSPWIVELTIPEEDVRHVLDRWSDRDAPPVVRFYFETSPEDVIEGVLDEIEPTIALNESGTLQSTARVLVDTPPAENVRVGVGVVAAIDCGQRKVGFVYLRRLLEAVRRQFVF